MKQYRFWKALKILVVVIVAALVFGQIVMHLWNWLMPAIFGLKALNFGQALGLLVLSKLIFGGFHRHGGGRGWRRNMEERWATMSPEQREQFRSGMRGRGMCDFGPSRKAGSERAAV